MQENFRRSIRKMTGNSVRLTVRPNRSSMVATLSQSMMVTWSIVLYEHLDAMLNDPSVNVGTSELISYSETAYKLADASFPQIIADANKLYDEFRTKWMQRFSTDEVMRLLLEGGDFLHHDEEKGWYLTVKNSKQDINAFYSATIHLLVSDAEPLFVRMHGRVMQLQEKLCKYWHSESAVDAMSKLLPSLEASLRDKENSMVVSLRSSLNALAKKRFAAAFATKGNTHYYSSAASCARNVGRYWNPHYAYENGFLAFTDDFCDYARGLTIQVIEWYQSKWAMFLRGFNRGQMNLFETQASFKA
ncbi:MULTISPECIES: hypothetical protein [unclassified Fibrobacter]|uniref:hypothetical protein n=2 Tax=unclassified Fibrobacter TaxID=2634177 RepID=UPI000933EA5B|nr:MULTISPECIES: hypothetical protein [unclassified Fibrobacter]OWV08145.1 hypothetical protein B7993_00455 [Fibrobacter sp. UWH3]OWV15360.1 hypothetical protein B7992_04725 [Fibrobacter sp. UWH1]